MKTRAIAIIVTVIAMVGLTYLLRSVTQLDQPWLSPVAGAIAHQPAPSALPEIERLISVFEERVATSTDALNYRTLGRHYLDRAYLTADPGSYRQAADALQLGLELAPDQPADLIDLARANLGLHQFRSARGNVERAVSLRPDNPEALLLMGDVLFAYGEYEQSSEYFETVAENVGDDPAVLIRRAEHAWHTGDNQGAIDMSRLAAETAVATALSARSQAFYLTEHAHHLANNGALDDALSFLERAIAADPSWPAAFAELARVQWLLGQDDRASSNIEIALSISPDISWQLLRIQILESTDDRVAVDEANAELAVLVRKASDAGPIYTRQIAAFFADTPNTSELAVKLLREEAAYRNDVYLNDLLGWALYNAGRSDEAWAQISRALDIGTRDPAVLFHAGIIAIEAGHSDVGRDLLATALAINPMFDRIGVTEADEILASRS